METQYLGNIWQDHNCLQLDSNMSEKAASNLVRFPNPLAFGSQAGTLSSLKGRHLDIDLDLEALDF